MGNCTEREKFSDYDQIPKDVLMKTVKRDFKEQKQLYSEKNLMLMAFEGDTKSIQEALNSGVSFQAVRGVYRILELGSESGGGAKCFCTKMWTPALFAVYTRNLEVVKHLVENAPNSKLILYSSPFFSEDQDFLQKVHKEA